MAYSIHARFRGNVQVTVDGQLSMVFHRPIPSRRGPAPQSNIRLAQPMRRFHYQRPVVDQDGLSAHPIETVFGVFNTLGAPLFDVYVRRDRKLIIKLDLCSRHCLLCCQPQRAKTVVIERKQRADGHIPEYRVRIFRGHHANRAQLPHQRTVSRLAADAFCGTVKQLMIARHPNHLGETLGQRF